MKKYIVALVLSLLSTQVSAHGYYHGPGYYSSNDLLGTLIIGGAIGYMMAPRTTYVAPPPVIYRTGPGVLYNYPIGGIPQAGYHYEDILDANCGCYRRVLVPGY